MGQHPGEGFGQAAVFRQALSDDYLRKMVAAAAGAELPPRFVPKCSRLAGQLPAFRFQNRMIGRLVSLRAEAERRHGLQGRE